MASGSPCTVTAGSTVTVTSGAIPGLTASGLGGYITADGITVNLGPGGIVGNRNYVGASAASGGTISLDGTIIKTVQVATGQRGIISSGAGSLIEGAGTAITIGLGATAASDLVAVLAQAGGAVALVNGSVSTLGGTNGTSNYGLWATGAGSEIVFSGGTVSTVGRGSFGAFADGGATITLSNGASISTTGLEITATGVGSHAVYASGAGSLVTGTGITLSTSGTTANGARADNGGTVSLVSSTITSTSAAAAGKVASALSAASGGSVSLTGAGSTITTTGGRSHGLSVQDAGSTGVLSDVTMTVSGTLANGVLVDAGEATVTNTVMTVRGSVGVIVQNSGQFDMTGGAIRTTASTAAGINVSTGSIANLTGTEVTTGWDASVLNGGLNAPAVQVGTGAVFTGTDLTVTTNGDGRAYGAIAGVNGTLNLIGGSVDTYGDATDSSTSNARRPEALVAQGANAVLNATGTAVHTRGLEGFAVVADDGGTVLLDDVTVVTDGTLGIGLYALTDQSIVNNNTITMTGGSIETNGSLGHGALASQSNLAPLATVNLTGTPILTHGAGATGLRALGMGTVNASAGTVDTLGVNAHGIYARDNGSSVNLDSMVVTTSGTSAHGGVAERGGLLTGTNSLLTVTGANSAGLYVAGEPGFVSAAEFTGSEIRNVSGPTIGIAGSGNVTLTDSFAGGSGQWLLVGTIDDFPALLAPEPLHAHRTDEEIGADLPTALPLPPALAASPGLANVDLIGTSVSGSAITRAGSISHVTMTEGSFWDLTGNSNLTTLLNDLSLIDFSSPVGDPQSLASYKTLTTVDYVGADGVIDLNTYLASDGAPSDKLVIDNCAATGTTGLIITNNVGPGALTVNNGILVIEAINGAVTSESEFFLAREVVAGPYEYSLFYGSVDGSGIENWYLRSTLDCELVDPPVDPCDDPAYRQEVSVAAALPALMDFYGRNLIDTLHERVGENAPGHPGTIGFDAQGTPVWGRVMGHIGTYRGDPLGIYGGDGPSFEYSMGALQAGVDLYRREDDSGATDRAGAYIATGSASADVEHSLSILGKIDGGTASLGAYSLGGYWTHYNAEGGYLDAIVQGTFYTLDMDTGRRQADTTATGLAASLEAGYPIALSEGWLLEPQAQAIGQLFSIDPFSDGAAEISYENLGSLVARVGIRLAHDFTVERPTGPIPASAWLRANLWHQFAGQPTTLFSSEDGLVPFTADLRDTWLELGLGADVSLDAATSLYAAINYQTDLDGQSTGLSARLGLKGNW